MKLPGKHPVHRARNGQNRAEPPNQLIVGFTQRSVSMSPNPRVFGFACGPARSLLVSAALAAANSAEAGPPPLGMAPELYQPLHGGAFTGKPAPLSPDPLVAYVFGPGVNHTALQIFTVRPVAVAVLSGKCDGCESLATATPKATITGPVQVLIRHFNALTPHTFTTNIELNSHVSNENPPPTCFCVHCSCGLTLAWSCPPGWSSVLILSISSHFAYSFFALLWLFLRG
jgi:hypothetical protein